MLAGSCGRPPSDRAKCGAGPRPTLFGKAPPLASTPLRPQLPPAGSFLLLAAAVLSYIPYLLAILAGPTWGDTCGGAPYGAGWAILFAVVFGNLLWFAVRGVVVV